MNNSRLIKDVVLKSNKKIVITGAGGWFGRATLNMLDRVCGEHLSSKVILYGRRNKIYELESGRSVKSRSISEIGMNPNIKGSLFLHYACLTKDKLKDLHVDEYISENRLLFDKVYNVIKKSPPCGIFYPSTGDVYNSLGRSVYEQPYGSLKLEAENQLINLSYRLGIPCSIFRVFNVSGPYINKFGSYALETILSDIINKRTVKILSSNPVWRSYVSITDVISVAVQSLLVEGYYLTEPVDCAGSEVIEIADLARRCILRTNSKSKIVRENTGNKRKENFYIGDYLSWNRVCNRYNYKTLDLNNQIDETYSYLKNKSSA